MGIDFSRHLPISCSTCVPRPAWRESNYADSDNGIESTDSHSSAQECQDTGGHAAVADQQVTVTVSDPDDLPAGAVTIFADINRRNVSTAEPVDLSLRTRDEGHCVRTRAASDSQERRSRPNFDAVAIER